MQETGLHETVLDETGTDAARSAAHARLIEDNLVLTCEASLLYGEGGFPGSPQLLERLSARVSARTRIVGEIFPGFPGHRPEPPRLHGGGDVFREKQRATLSAPRPPGPPTLLCESLDIRLAGNALFHVEDGRPQVLFETFRPQERPVVPGPGADFGHVDETVPEEGITFLLNSAGSFNYGHWLIDDLPRLRALETLRRRHPREPVTVALVGYFPHIDEARRRSIGLFLGGLDCVRIRFLDRSRTYRFARLHHATPSGLPAGRKSPDSLRFLTRHLRRRTLLPRWWDAIRRLAGRGQGRLFVDRNPARGRALANRAEILATLRGHGFAIVDPEALSVRQQVRLFAKARLVAGIAGAGMANTVFCAPQTPIVHLVPEGWEDLFYAEIAAACGHRYHAVFGPRIASEAPEHLHDFSVEPVDLRAALAAAGL